MTYQELIDILGYVPVETLTTVDNNFYIELEGN